MEETGRDVTAGGIRVFSGWIVGRAQQPCCAVRARSGGQTGLGLSGLARPDVAAAHPTEPDAALSGFRVELAGLGRDPVRLEWLDGAGHWHEFWREPVASAAIRSGKSAGAVLPSALLPVLLAETAGAMRGRSWREAWPQAEWLLSDHASRLTPVPPHPELTACLDEPAGDCHAGPFLPVSGWVFGSRSPIKRLFARIEPGGMAHLIYPRPRPDVAAAHAASSAPVACGFTGMIKLPEAGVPWFSFRLYAEWADGSVQLAISRRFFVKSMDLPVNPGWRPVLMLAALALRGRYRPQSWGAWWRELRHGLARPSAPSPAARPAPSLPAPAAPTLAVEPQPGDPLISIVVPVFNPPPRYLAEMIASVQAQHYPRWELCLADDASTAPHVRPLLEECARADPRIRPVFRSENGHIARATNTALAQAAGEFVALLDHDDLLAPEALRRVVEAIRAHAEVQFLYTDRDKVDDHGRHFDGERRGAWNPAMAITHNYLHQLTVIRRGLVELIGGFRPDYFGSQDLDLYLRCHELLQPGQIVHVPVIGYHWRAHAGSTASRGDQKAYMFDSARRGIEDALQRRGLRARPFLPDFAPLYGLNLHQLRWDAALLRENPVSLVLAVTSPGDAWPATVAALVRTVPVGTVQVIIVSSDPVRSVNLSAAVPLEYAVAPAGTPPAGLFNLGAALARHPLLLLLDAEAAPTGPGWLEDLVGWLSVPGVDAAGPKLLGADGLLASAGWTINPVSGRPEALWTGEAPDDLGHQFRLHTARDSLLLDPACLLTRTALFRELGGYAGDDFPAACFAADYCLRLHDRGRRVVFTPQAVLRLASGPAPRATAPGPEDVTFQHRHAGRTDPWIPSDLFPPATDVRPGPGRARPEWMPGRTVEFSGGWFYLEHPQPGETLPSGGFVLIGWCVVRPGQAIEELRLRAGTQTRLLTYGHPRADLATASGCPGEFFPAGFDLELDLPPGRTSLEFEAWQEDSGWLPVDRVEVTVVAGATRGRAATGLPAAASVTQLAEGMELLAGSPAAGGLRVRARALAQALPWQDAVRNPALPFHGFWDEPAGIVRPIYGGAEVRGWLFHETLAIRRVVAGFTLAERVPLAHQHNSSLISGKFARFPSAARCAVAGFVPAPLVAIQPVPFRLWAELEDGTWHLVYVRRCWIRAAGEDRHAPAQAVGWRVLLTAALAFRWALWRAGVPAPGLPALGPVVRRLHRKFLPTAPAAAPSLRSRAPVPPPAQPHVLLVTHNLNQEGAPYFLLELACYVQRETGTRLTVVSTADGPLREEFVRHGMAVRLIDREPLWIARTPGETREALEALAQELQAHESSLVLANTIESFWAVQAAQQAGRPSLFYIHEPGVFGLHYLGHLGAATRALAAQALTLATTRVSFPSRATQAYYTSFAGRGNQRIQAGWTDLGRLVPADRAGTRAEVRARLGLAPDEQLVITVGTICARKGQLFFVNAIERLEQTHPALAGKCRFLLIGDHDNPYGEMLATQVAGLRPALVTLLPATPRIGDYYAAADLFVLSSFEEGFPRVLLEAMGFGLPVVGTAIHAIPEIARAGREALLVPPGDARALAEAMQRLLADRSFARRLGQQARRRVEENYTAERVLPDHLRTMRELVPALAAAAPRIPRPDLPEPIRAAS